MTKAELRTLYKQRRIDLSKEDLQKLNSSLLNQLKAIDWSKFTYLHVFLSIEKFNEPDTLGFIKWIRSEYAHIKLVLSKSDFSTGSMTNYLFDSSIRLELNEWGIPEPVEGIVIEDKVIDAVIVPLLVVDKFGNRVGYGKGFYDRFLQKCKTDITTFGLSFFDLVSPIDDVDVWDQKLNFCVTPNEVYHF